MGSNLARGPRLRNRLSRMGVPPLLPLPTHGEDLSQPHLWPVSLSKPPVAVKVATPTHQGVHTMSADRTNGRRGRVAVWGSLAIMFGLTLAVAGSDVACAAEPAPAPSVPAGFCKAPTTRPALASGFVLLCGKRMPAGVFLGSFLSPA